MDGKRMSASGFPCVYHRLMGLKKIGGGFFTTKMASLCVGGLWVLSITLNAPQLAWADVMPTYRARQDCNMPYINPTVMTIFPTVKNIFVFFTPLVVTWISYGSIIYKSRKNWKAVTVSKLYRVNKFEQTICINTTLFSVVIRHP